MSSFTFTTGNSDDVQSYILSSIGSTLELMSTGVTLKTAGNTIFSVSPASGIYCSLNNGASITYNSNNLVVGARSGEDHATFVVGPTYLNYFCYPSGYSSPRDSLIISNGIHYTNYNASEQKTFSFNTTTSGVSYNYSTDFSLEQSSSSLNIKGQDLGNSIYSYNIYQDTNSFVLNGQNYNFSFSAVSHTIGFNFTNIGSLSFSFGNSSSPGYLIIGGVGQYYYIGGFRYRITSATGRTDISAAGITWLNSYYSNNNDIMKILADINDRLTAIESQT